tara:strand:- start:818 stop:1858 length:1041 start_codon:yes stop_codon:yes gene_type:complete
MNLPRYDRQQSYQWNYDNAPGAVELEIPKWPGNSSFCGFNLQSPLGMPAGPLLNGKWCLYYASLGFDFVTYKTVRSRYRACYDLPNLQPVRVGMLNGCEVDVPTQQNMTGSWAVSYGMPSTEPEIWRADVARTRDLLADEKILCVSVVGSVQPDWSLQQLADDYALCARQAVDSGADCVEANFSCPNVSTCDGQLYQIPEDCQIVTKTIRDEIGDTPLIAKIGRIARPDKMCALLEKIHPFIDALAMTNSIATRVKDKQGKFLFDGQLRGICGKATLNASVEQTQLANDINQEYGYALELIGVGGASCLADVQEYINAGATAVHLATAAMENPRVAIEIKAEAAAK